MRFNKFTFSFASPLLGVHAGANPVNGKRFVHVAPLPFFGIDFDRRPYEPRMESDRWDTETERVTWPLFKAVLFYGALYVLGSILVVAL